MVIAFYVPNIDFYNKIAPFLKEKHFSWEGGVSPLMRPISTEPFYLYLSYMGFLYEYKNDERLFKATWISMRFFPFESENINFL